MDSLAITIAMSMDIDTPMDMVSTQVDVTSIKPIPQRQPTILCYNCGAPIDGTSAAGALCADCVRLTIDISEGIPRGKSRRRTWLSKRRDPAADALCRGHITHLQRLRKMATTSGSLDHCSTRVERAARFMFTKTTRPHKGQGH